MLSLVDLFQLTGFRNGRKQVFVLPHSRWEESPEASWISSGSLGTLLPSTALPEVNSEAPLMMLLISLAFRLACSWEMSTAQEQEEHKEQSAQFCCFSVYPLWATPSSVECQSCLPQEEGAHGPAESSLCPSHFPSDSLFQHLALHAVSLARIPTSLDASVPKPWLRLLRVSSSQPLSEQLQKAAGTGLHTSKYPLSRASSVGCLFISPGGLGVEPQSRLSEGVNREEETGRPGRVIGCGLCLPQLVSNWKSSQTSLQNRPNISAIRRINGDSLVPGKWSHH